MQQESAINHIEEEREVTSPGDSAGHAFEQKWHQLLKKEKHKEQMGRSIPNGQNVKMQSLCVPKELDTEGVDPWAFTIGLPGVIAPSSLLSSLFHIILMAERAWRQQPQVARRQMLEYLLFLYQAL